MEQDITCEQRAQRVTWETLEACVRAKAQEFIQGLLEEEVTELLGRGKSERRAVVDAPAGYRNGHGKPRRLTLGSGTITVRRPRVRDLEERFESRILPLFVRRSREVNDLIPELYLHGLAEGDFDLALRGLLGEEAPVSASTVARLKTKWQAETAAWNARRLDDLEVVYLWVDGVYVKAGLEDRKAAVLVLLAGLSDGRKVLVALKSGQRESTESWASILRDVRARGLRAPRLVIGDGHLGIWAGLRQVYPEAQEQRCWNHRILNLLDRIGKRNQPAATALLRNIVYADTREKAERQKTAFQEWCRQRGYEDAGKLIDEDWERMVTFYSFPKEHWGHLRTTNPVESPFAALRLRTAAAKRFKRVENATAVICKMLLIAEQRFRRLNAPDLMPDVFLGVQYVNGMPVSDQPQVAAA
jgi:transposase-like protein